MSPGTAASGVVAEVDVQCGNWHQEIPDAEQVCVQAVAAAARASGVSVATAEVSVVLADDAFVQDLNDRYRGVPAPTNVLAFPQSEPPGRAGSAGDPRPRLLGDIVVAYGTVIAEAREAERPAGHHLSHMVVHGMLHLLGFDHETDNEAAAMQAREVEALDRLRIPDPYQRSRVGAQP